MSVTLSAKDVERPLRAKLEIWRAAVKGAMKDVIDEQVADVATPTDHNGFIKAIALLNGGKDAVTTFASGSRVAGAIAAPQFAVPAAVLSHVSSALRKDDKKRIKLIERDFESVLEDFMFEVRKAEDKFPTDPQGMELCQRIANAASDLVFDNEAVRNTWCRRFIENIGALEYRESQLKPLISKGFKPIFRKLGLIIGEGLRSDRSRLLRWLGADPKWKWSGFDIHVPGTHASSGGTEWPGAIRSGFRRATSDEIRDIVTNFWRYKITSRTILVGAYGYASMNRIVECQPITNVRKEYPVPNILGEMDSIFSPFVVPYVVTTTMISVGSGVRFADT